MCCPMAPEDDVKEEEEGVSVNIKQTPEARKNIEIRGEEKRGSGVTGS